ncbi:glycosyltransferase family 4 protein [Luteimonas viscosa]|uniref:Glycosyltransferase family 4 protein n=1 Tax=Luteimonas viscosa TaxID=1132694 RepID=A0A5D4XEP2_9GAMM|nr:glycosyltransferase [Luteimonas viscosa]TYT23027.1 glycosyltransferase family 4 protein [Luteimonas viscosa]
MRVLVVCKRQYTGKDLVSDRFGRLYELPLGLASLMDEVRICALSYRRRGGPDAGRFEGTTVEWRSLDALPVGLARHGAWLDDVTEGWRPDVVWASSDMLQAVLAARWARRHGIPCVIDLYDNYESFGLSRLPGLTAAFRSACMQAAALTVVSDSLAEYVRVNYRPPGPVITVVNGIRTDLFYPREKSNARSLLGLPQGARLIGTAGALTADRGIEDLFNAFEKLSKDDENLWLVHAGPTDKSARRDLPRVLDLGMLPQARVPEFLAALDVGVICNRDTPFGRHCFPMKLYEMLSMHTPIVAAALGDVARILAENPACLYPVGNVEILCERIVGQLNAPSVANLTSPTWRMCAASLKLALDSYRASL